MIMNEILIVNQKLSSQVDNIKFSVNQILNPLNYVWDGFRQYAKFANGPKRVIFLGMNPGPWGMAQTGIPFGEVNAVKNFLGITEINVNPPAQGLDCKRSEVSGKRLWGLFREKFETAENFFAENFVLNYCPLLFKDSSRNITPDKLPRSERQALCEVCDEALVETVRILRPQFVVGVGNFAYERARAALPDSITVTKILHPSPANPQANNNWSTKTETKLLTEGVWTE